MNRSPKEKNKIKQMQDFFFLMKLTKNLTSVGLAKTILVLSFSSPVMCD